MHLFRSRHFIVLFICFVVIHIAFFAVYGIRSFYDSVVYVKSADYLLEHGTLEEAYYVFYFLPIALIAVCHAFFPGEVLPFLLLQIAVSGFAVICLYKASEKLFKSNIAALLSSLTFLLWWDNLHWNITIMTESIFCSLFCIILYRLVSFEGKRSDWIALFALSLAVVLTRPTGIIVIAGIIVCLYYYYRASLPRTGTPMIVVISLLIAIAGAGMMFSIWDFTDQYNRGNVVTYADVAEKKNLNYDGLRIDTTQVMPEHSQDHPLLKMIHFALQNPLHFSKAFAMKVGYLISATRPYYSWKHNLFSLVWLALVYTLLYFGFRKCENTALKSGIMVIILLNCLLIGISSVDWDNRFYVPMFPGIALLAGGGGAYLFDRVKKF